ncbi:MAG TPA: energy-coupling factor transporter transmembrane protein EcfT [Desulfotomaculum sp.]|nr:energy-coupling factor transporter transmembrane protein EcfT [Desulfotomaculum sp.]
MLAAFCYQDRGTLLQGLHTGAALFYLATLCLLALVLAHPLYLAGLFLVLILAITAAGARTSWAAYMRAGVWLVALILLINPLVSRAGETVLWQGPSLPVVGVLTISLEAVCFGAAMGLRLLVILSVFCLYNAIIHPDKALSLLSRVLYRSVLVVALATRLLPAMVRRLASIKEAQQMRGLDFAAGSLRKRVKNYSLLLNILLLSSLEGALETAEAMQARGFGRGPRSRYQRELLRPRDICCFAGSGLALAAGVYAAAGGAAGFSYYPELAPLSVCFPRLLLLAVMLMGLLVPVALAWGWRRSCSLRSRI